MQPIDRSRNDVRVEAATLQPKRLRQRSLRQPLQVESLCLLFSASRLKGVPHNLPCQVAVCIALNLGENCFGYSAHQE
jgi:hypothetical protein